jgi:putative serine protease PepD
MTAMRTLASFLGGAACVGLVVGALAVAGVLDDDARSAETAAPTATATAQAAAEPAARASVAAIYRRVAPSVVFVQANSGRGRLPFPGGGQAASGSGFVIDTNGHGDRWPALRRKSAMVAIVTNEHVVAGAGQFRVRFGDNGRPLKAKLVGKDASTDLAVLEVDAKAVPGGLKPLALGSLDALVPGDTAIAIGSPFGLQETVTSGIVSALGRTIHAPNGVAIADAIQTDAAINPGNSGGPLLDGQGRVIGVTSQIRTENGNDGNTGVGFAVPVSTIRAVVPQLEKGRSIAHAFLGVSTTATSDLSGANVMRVVAGGPAARAGVRRGDEIVAVDGRPIRSPDDLSAQIARHRPSDRAQVSVLRGGERRTLTVTLGKRPNTPVSG